MPGSMKPLSADASYDEKIHDQRVQIWDVNAPAHPDASTRSGRDLVQQHDPFRPWRRASMHRHDPRWSSGPCPSGPVQLVQADVHRRRDVQRFDGARSRDREGCGMQRTHLLARQAARFVAEHVAVELAKRRRCDRLAREIERRDAREARRSARPAAHRSPPAHGKWRPCSRAPPCRCARPRCRGSSRQRKFPNHASVRRMVPRLPGSWIS